MYILYDTIPTIAIIPLICIQDMTPYNKENMPLHDYIIKYDKYAKSKELFG